MIQDDAGRFLEISTRGLQRSVAPDVMCRRVRLQHRPAVLRHEPLLYLPATSQQHEVSTLSLTSLSILPVQ